MSYIYPVQEWEQKVLRRFRRQPKAKIKPLSNREIRELTEEIFLEG